MYTVPGNRDIELPREGESILRWAQEITRRANRRIHGVPVVEGPMGDILILDQPTFPPAAAGSSYGGCIGAFPDEIYTDWGPIYFISPTLASTDDVTLEQVDPPLAGLKFANAGTYMLTAAVSFEMYAIDVPDSHEDIGKNVSIKFVKTKASDSSVADVNGSEFISHHHELYSASSGYIYKDNRIGEVVIPSIPVTLEAGDHVNLYIKSSAALESEPMPKITKALMTAHSVGASVGGGTSDVTGIDGGTV